jgi:hypothetical protein
VHAAGIIDRMRCRNRLVELKSKVMMTAEERDEIQYLERVCKVNQTLVDDIPTACRPSQNMGGD